MSGTEAKREQTSERDTTVVSGYEFTRAVNGREINWAPAPEGSINPTVSEKETTCLMKTR